MQRLQGPRRPKPLYRRRSFWLLTGAAAVVAAGVAAFFLTQTFPVLDSQSAKTGKIAVTTHPDKATIKLDGKKVGKKSDTTLTTKPGRHTVTLSLTGYDTQDVLVIVKEGQTYQLDHVFTRNGQTVLSSPKPGHASSTVYTNSKFGYRLTYPAQWSVSTDPSGQAHFYNEAATRTRQQSPNAEVEEAFAVLVSDNPQDLSPEAYYRARPEYADEDQSQITQKSVTIGGKPAYQYDTPYGFVPYTNTIFTGNRHAYLFQIKQGSPDRTIYDQILGTFTLI